MNRAGNAVREARRQGAKAAQRLIGVFRRHRPTEVAHRVIQGVGEVRIGRRRASHEKVRMAAHVLCEGLNGKIDPVGQGFEPETGRPGVVEEGQNTARLRHARDPWRVLYLKGERARRFHEDQARRGGEQRRQGVG